jgi:hypothetical protein
MSSVLRTREPKYESLPTEIYLPLVDSLYQDRRTLLFGTIFIMGSVFVTYWKTGDPLLLYVALAALVVACGRAAMIHAYFRARATVVTMEDGRRWENRYVGGASALHGLLGVWCFIAFSTSDPFAQLVSFSMTGAYVAGIFGRNFANARFVMVQILCTWTPMTAALLIYGSWLMAIHYPTAVNDLWQRYPFIPATVSERRRLFERAPMPASRNDKQHRSHDKSLPERIASFIGCGCAELAGGV